MPNTRNVSRHNASKTQGKKLVRFTFCIIWTDAYRIRAMRTKSGATFSY